MWQPGMGNPASGCRFSIEMYGVWTSDHGGAEAGGEEYQRGEKTRDITYMFQM